MRKSQFRRILAALIATAAGVLIVTSAASAATPSGWTWGGVNASNSWQGTHAATPSGWTWGGVNAGNNWEGVTAAAPLGNAWEGSR